MKLTHSICGTTGKMMKDGKWAESFMSRVPSAGKVGGIVAVIISVVILMGAATVLAAVITSFLAEFGDYIRLQKGW